LPSRGYSILRWTYVVLPILAGLDKVLSLLPGRGAIHPPVLVSWDKYLAPLIRRPLPLPPRGVMDVVGVIEILAGILVIVRPRIGAYVVAVWLLAIVINLLLIPGYFDIALRDLALAAGALALARMSTR
jgi:uncharacterized membrane protein YphA (DoxX/SURF4 family)